MNAMPNAAMSDVAIEARRLFAAGVLAFPASANAKHPDRVKHWAGDHYPPDGWPSANQHFGMFQRDVARMFVVCGSRSGGVAALDFDQEGYFEEWAALVPDDLYGRLYIEQSQRSGNYHVAFKVEGGIESSTPARDPRKADGTDGDIRIEVRGDGNGFTAAPSVGYQRLSGDLANLPILTAEEYRLLIAAAAAFNACAPRPRHERKARTVRPADGDELPGTRYNRENGQDEVLALFARHGYAIGRHDQQGNVGITRPGATSETSGNVSAGGITHMFSTNTPFEPSSAGRGEPHTPFAVYAILEHGGDFSAAGRALHRGYGRPHIIPIRPDTAPEPGLPERAEASSDGPTGNDLAPAGAPSEDAPVGGASSSSAQLAAFEVWGVIKTLADAIVADDHFAQDDGGKLHVYDNGLYAPHGTRHVRERVKGLLERWGMAKKWSSHRADEVAEYIRITAPLLWDRPPLDRINVLNGIVILATKERMDHTPEYLSPVQLPVTFDPQATCPQWEQFVKQTFPEDAQSLAWEMLADLMQPDRSEQRGILLTGEGGNGKSVYLRAVTAFVGTRNITSMSLQKLETDRFAVARLHGRLGNICADLPSVHLETTSVFKAITGGDSLQGEYKYGNGFEFIPFSRLIFSANHLPRSSDSSHAFFRRWLVVPFDNTFEGAAALPREELDARLSDPKELSGVLNKALDALPRLRKNGFTESAAMRKALDEFRATTDPLSVWIENTIEVAPDAWVARDALNRAFAEHCRKEGSPVMAPNAFGRALRRLRPDLTACQRTWQGRGEVWCWLGIQLRGGVPPPSHLPPTDPQIPQVPQVSPICNKFKKSEEKERGREKV